MGEGNASQSEAWLRLNASGLSPKLQLALLDAFDSPEAIFGATNEQLRAVDGIASTHLGKLRSAEAETDTEALLESLGELDAHPLPILDERYPPLLREIDDPPPLLFVRGGFSDRDDLAVALVGTRKRSPYGEMVAEQLSRDLVRRGFTVVSGLAMGIDADAHEATLEAGGRTIAVTACGIDVNYPAANADLRERIAQSGAVISELAPGTPPTRDRFPQRNRILSGLALGTVVIEAPGRSGALITARLAGETGRGVFAVPGNVTSPVSRGCHELLRDGAVLVETAEDIVEGLGIMLEAVPEREPEAERARKLAELPTDQREVLGALSHQPRNIDDVAGECGLPVPQVSAALMLLEVKGLVKRFPGNQFVRTG
ncbi:MAG: DNA-processing protein DprA [Armatimonadota bacterium]|jgi:DNA processing protein